MVSIIIHHRSLFYFQFADRNIFKDLNSLKNGISTMVYSTAVELVPEPCPYLTLVEFFSKFLRQKLKVTIYSYRASLALSEFNFTFELCRVVFEKFDLKAWFKYSTVSRASWMKVL